MLALIYLRLDLKKKKIVDKSATCISWGDVVELFTKGFDNLKKMHEGCNGLTQEKSIGSSMVLPSFKR